MTGTRVAVFSLGGTIAMADLHGTGAVVPALGAADLLAGVPLPADVAVQPHDVRQVPGASVRLDDLAGVQAAAREAVRAGVDGVVVTQGTDTIEETAFALDLWWDQDAPLVVTGAMRNPTLAGPDGPANVQAAVTTAASRSARGLGCLVVLNDEIHAARWVRKSHTANPGAFRSPLVGPIGYVVEGAAHLPARPTARPAPVPPPDRPLAEVRTAVVPMVLGDAGVLLRACDDLDGLVVAGFGVGHVPADLVEPISRLAGRLPVVLASRVNAGPVLEAMYGFPGSESDMHSRGLIPAGSLGCYQARILLHLLLAGGAGPDAIARAFATYPQ